MWGVVFKVVAMSKKKIFKSSMANEVIALQELQRLKEFLIDYSEIEKAANVTEVISLMRFGISAILLKNPGWPSYDAK